MRGHLNGIDGLVPRRDVIRNAINSRAAGDGRCDGDPRDTGLIVSWLGNRRGRRSTEPDHWQYGTGWHGLPSLGCATRQEQVVPGGGGVGLRTCLAVAPRRL